MFNYLLISERKVEMIGKESIHAIVLGVFSAAIMSDDIHGKFKFRRVRFIVLLLMVKKGTGFLKMLFV